MESAGVPTAGAAYPRAGTLHMGLVRDTHELRTVAVALAERVSLPSHCAPVPGRSRDGLDREGPSVRRYGS